MKQIYLNFSVIFVYFDDYKQNSVTLYLIKFMKQQMEEKWHLKCMNFQI